ncbi:unnamed protein product [Ectocarpus sp. CCAP 1310/34]|nr:unnamed protein product [Ectocarpus sp. CCAP 1310/34]
MMGDEVLGMIAIHVDDILYAGIERLAKMVVEALGDSLPTKNLGEVRFFLGCAFVRDREAGTIEMSQESYIRSVLERFNVCRTSSIPASLANDYRVDFVAMGDGVKEALFVNGMLELLRPSDRTGKIQVREDNEGAIVLAENPLSSCNRKHIDVRHHFLRNLAEEGVLEIRHVSSEGQHADILTKALPRDLFGSSS